MWFIREPESKDGDWDFFLFWARPKIPGNGISLGSGISRPKKNPQKNQKFKFLKNPLSRWLEIFWILGIFIPGDRGFLSPRFLPNSRKCIILMSQRFEIFFPGFLTIGFFYGKGYPTKKPPLMVDSNYILCFNCVCDPIPKNSIRRVFRKVSQLLQISQSVC